jgi:hypothetical protein
MKQQGLVNSQTNAVDLLAGPNNQPLVENIANKKGNSGWSMFETHLENAAPTACPNFIDENAGYVSWTYKSGGNTVQGPSTFQTRTAPAPDVECTVNTGSSGYYYSSYPAPGTQSDNTWTVISQASGG